MKEIASGVAWTYTSFVNIYFIGEPGGPWALVDSGLPFFSPKVRAEAAARYGPDARPEAIFLTHGHFDHAGSALALAEYWDVPVYAHRLELPYLNGHSDYPPPDPTVGGGIPCSPAYCPTAPATSVIGCTYLRRTRVSPTIPPAATRDRCPVSGIGAGFTRRDTRRGTSCFTARPTTRCSRATPWPR